MAPLLDPFASLFGSSGFFDQSLASSAAATGFSPPVDIVDTGGHLSVYMDAPGLRAENLEIAIEGGALSIRGERSYPAEYEQARTRRRIERGFGGFERKLRVPEGLDSEGVQASTKDGVLILQIPKPESQKLRRVEIKGGSSSEQPVIEGTAT